MPRRFALLPVSLGAAAATGFAPLEWLPVMLAAIAVWLKLVHDARSLRAALATGWLFGLGHFIVNNNWIQHAFDFQDRMPPVLGYGAVVALAAYLAVYPMLAAGLAWRLASPRAVGDTTTRPGAAFMLVAGAAWIVSEWLRARMFTGYAWDPLGVAWLALPDVALGARFVGTYALSGLLVATAGAALLIATGRRWQLAAILAGLLAGLALVNIGYGVDRAATASRVRIVQPNVGQDARSFADRPAEMLRRLIALSGRPGPVPRLVVWPEGAVDYALEDGYPPAWYHRGDPRDIRTRIAAALGPRDLALIGGTALVFAVEELSGVGNAVWPMGADARLGARYDKAHLVPYGEYLPMRTLLEPLGLSRLVAGESDYLSGPGPRTIVVPGFGPIAVQICYEIIFSGEVVDRAGPRPALLFNPSNDAWFGSWGPVQHLAQARMRAIEEGLPVIRSTPNGISAAIAPDGRVVAAIPRFRAAAIELPLPGARPPTLVSRAGNWLAFAVAGLMLVLAVALRRR